jgi:hypothetical protein
MKAQNTAQPYKPKAKEVKRLELALVRFKETTIYKDLPDDYKEHLR